MSSMGKPTIYAGREHPATLRKEKTRDPRRASLQTTSPDVIRRGSRGEWSTFSCYFGASILVPLIAGRRSPFLFGVAYKSKDNESGGAQLSYKPL